MYSEQDVRDAVAAGAISAEAAEGLRTYVSGARVAPATDERPSASSTASTTFS